MAASSLDVDLPKIYKGLINDWGCYGWGWPEWARFCGEELFTFRSALITRNTETLLWEGDAENVESTVSHFTSWLSKQSNALEKDNKLKKFDHSLNWCYSSYNYMSEIFAKHSEKLDIVKWDNFGFERRNGLQSTLWIGSAHAHTPCHQDSYGSNLVAQLIGRKLWVLFPPSDEVKLYPTRIPYEETSVFSKVNILNPNLKQYPLFCTAKPYTVILEPGDVLYLPPKWYHYVYCLDDSISINTWLEAASDSQSKVEEAVVKFMMTAFVPTFNKNNNKEWLNPNEELMDAGELGEILKYVVRQANNDIQCDGKTKNLNILKNDYSMKFLDKTSVNGLKELLVSLNLVDISLEFEEGVEKTSFTIEDIVNCFVHPRVVKEISKVLKEQKRSCSEKNISQ